MILLLRFLFLIAGIALIVVVLVSALRTFVLPRSANDPLTRYVSRLVRKLFIKIAFLKKSYQGRDRILAYYAPVSVLLLLPIWLLLLWFGYAALFWGITAKELSYALRISGSSLLTLGFAAPNSGIETILVLSEATIGLILIALLIAYLPTMYAAFSRREIAVTLLEVRAGNPPSAVEMIMRFYRNHGLNHLNDVWIPWESWFADIRESHTSLSALVFFRSPEPSHSWVTASAAVLDAASLTLAAVDISYEPAAALCIRAGYLAFQHIADFFRIPYPGDPHFPDVPISVTRIEFDEACQRLRNAGVPLVADLNQAWNDFAGWRVNYDYVLQKIAELIIIPPTPWIKVKPID